MHFFSELMNEVKRQCSCQSSDQILQHIAGFIIENYLSVFVEFIGCFVGDITYRTIGQCRFRFPSFSIIFIIAGAHEDADVHGAVHADLAGEAEFAEYAVFFEAIVFLLIHFWFGGVEGDAAGGAAGETAAAVADVNAIGFDGVDEFGVFLDLERADAFDGDGMGVHVGNVTRA